VILAIIRRLGAKGGVGWAYEYGGAVVDALTMDERMTICNMSIEGGALCGYVNPDATTIAYLDGRPYAPRAAAWEAAVAYWGRVASDRDARYDDRVVLDGGQVAPMVTWGVSPAQCVGVHEPVPEPDALPENERTLALDAYEYMGVEPGRPLVGMPIDVAFVGSCANSRIGDFEAVAAVIRATRRRVPTGVRALIVPGSEAIHQELVARGLAALFVDAGFQVRRPGCSLCIGMNSDALEGRQVCASTSTRNFKGRQGSAFGRTLLMSPAMVAAAALTGQVVDARELMRAGANA
jgi:3-isopropylmalate/(R)-2-methylmalate dehydratase large subunit